MDEIEVMLAMLRVIGACIIVGTVLMLLID